MAYPESLGRPYHAASLAELFGKVSGSSAIEGSEEGWDPSSSSSLAPVYNVRASLRLTTLQGMLCSFILICGANEDTT